MEEVFVQHRDKEPFENIRTGIKKTEIRLNDEKRWKIKVGMKIKVVSREDENVFFFTRVVGLSRFEDFKGLRDVLGDKIKNYEWKILDTVYSEEDVLKYGVLVIHFELLD